MNFKKKQSIFLPWATLDSFIAVVSRCFLEWTKDFKPKSWMAKLMVDLATFFFLASLDIGVPGFAMTDLLRPAKNIGVHFLSLLVL